MCSSEGWNGFAEFAKPQDIDENSLLHAVNSRYIYDVFAEENAKSISI